MANVEPLLVAWLKAQRATARVVTETPSNLETLPWTIQVVRAGGSQQFTLDHPRIVLHTFALEANGKSARENAAAYATDVNDLMRWQLKGVQLGAGCWVSSVDVVSGPNFAADVNTALRHYAATYTLHLSDH